MKARWLSQYLFVVFVVLFGLSGCAMQPTIGANGESYVAFNDKKLLSKEQAKLLDRDLRASRIKRDMKAVGFEFDSVSPLFDGINYSILKIFKNQYELLDRYKTLVDNHKDVMSFINANKDKSPAELLAEAKRLDAQLTKSLSPGKKHKSIVKKMKEYQIATASIYAENTRLAAELLLQGVRMAAILRDNFEEVIGVEGIAMLLNAAKLHKQSKLAEARLHMSAVANEFIDDEKAVIDITKEIQKIIDQQI